MKVADDSWIPEYAVNVHPIVHKYGGKYHSRSANLENVEGDPLDATVIAVIEFPDRETIHNFMNDPEYAPYKKARMEGTDSTLVIIDDSDVAGSIPYLVKG